MEDNWGTVLSIDIIYKMPTKEIQDIKDKYEKALEEERKQGHRSFGYQGMGISGGNVMFGISSGAVYVTSGTVMGFTRVQRENPIIQTARIHRDVKGKEFLYEENIHMDERKSYKINGAMFNENDFKRFFIINAFTPRDIFFLWNAEQRTAILRTHGYAMFFDEKNAKLLDRMSDTSIITNQRVTYELYDVKMHFNGNNTMWMRRVNDDFVYVRIIRVEDHSTHKHTFLCVPRQRETDTCRGAIAWTFNMRPEEYMPEYET